MLKLILYKINSNPILKIHLKNKIKAIDLKQQKIWIKIMYILKLVVIKSTNYYGKYEFYGLEFPRAIKKKQRFSLILNLAHNIID